MTQRYMYWAVLLVMGACIPMYAEHTDESVQLAHVRQAQVNQYTAKLRSEMAMHKKARIVLQTAGASMMVYQLYAMAKAFGLVGKKSVGDEHAQHVPVNPALAEEDKKGFFAATKDFFTCRQTYYTLAASGVELGSMVVFQKALEELQRRVFESDTLAWLTTLRAPLRLTIVELYAWERALLAETTCEVDPKRAAYVHANFVSSIETLAHNIEMIVGYMQYKAGQLHKKHAGQARSVARELMERVNKQITDIEVHMQQNKEGQEICGQNTLALLMELEQIIELECMHFARIEGSYWHESPRMHDC